MLSYPDFLHCTFNTFLSCLYLLHLSTTEFIENLEHRTKKTVKYFKDQFFLRLNLSKREDEMIISSEIS